MRTLLMVVVAALLWGGSAYAEQLVLRVNNNRVDCYNENACYVRTIYVQNVMAAVTNGDKVAALRSDGRVDVFSNIGNYAGTIFINDAVGVQISSDSVMVNLKDGRVNVYNLSNLCYVRTIY